MRTAFTQTAKVFFSLGAKLVRMVVLIAILCLSLAVMAPSQAHAAAQANDGVEKVACDGNENLRLTYDPLYNGARDICFSGSDYVGTGDLGGTLYRVSVFNYSQNNSKAGWLRVKIYDTGYWANLDPGQVWSPGNTFNVTQICLSCGYHPSDPSSV